MEGKPSSVSSQIEDLFEKARGSMGKAAAKAKLRTQLYDTLVWAAEELGVSGAGGMPMLRIRVTESGSREVSSLFVYRDGAVRVPQQETGFTWGERGFTAATVRPLLQSPRADGWLVDFFDAVVSGRNTALEIVGL